MGQKGRELVQSARHLSRNHTRWIFGRLILAEGSSPVGNPVSLEQVVQFAL